MEDADGQDLTLGDLDDQAGSNGNVMFGACGAVSASRGLPTSAEPESWGWSLRTWFVKAPEVILQ